MNSWKSSPIFEEDSRYSDGFAATEKAISGFLASIGGSRSSSGVDFKGLMSHILKSMGLFLKLRRQLTSYQLSSAEVRLFFESVKDICEFGIATSEQTSFEVTPLSVGLDLATHVFKSGAPDEESTGAPEEQCGIKNSVWQPMYWAVLNPRWSTSCDIQSLNTTLMGQPNKGETSISFSAQLLPLTKETLLHYAGKAAHCNTEVLHLLSRQAPRAAFAQDKVGNLPLHAAAQYTESVENLQYLLQLNPKAIQTKNKKGRTPIHVLVARITRSQLPLLECLLSVAEQEDLMIEDKEGNTPLHLTWYKWSMKDAVVTRRIFEANPEATLIPNISGELPLHCIASDCDSRYCEGGGPRTSSSIDEIESVIGAMVTYFNENVVVPDSPLLLVDHEKGNTPLHKACDARYTSAAHMLIPTILKACPRAAAVSNEEGLLPLQLYIEKLSRLISPRGAELINTVRLLLDANPLAARVPKDGEEDTYLLHEAAQHGSLEVVRMIYDAYPDAVREIRTGFFEDKAGAERKDCTPLHCAAWNRCPIEGPQIVRFLYEKYPEAALLPPAAAVAAGVPPNPQSFLTPMHFVLRSSIESMKFFCEAEPAALKVRDDDRNTPLYLFISNVARSNTSWNGTRFSGWENCDDSSVAVAKLTLLLKHCPEAAGIRGGFDNTTPYQVAKSSGAKASVLRMLLRAAPEVDVSAFRNLNYMARRGAMYLLHTAVPGNDKDMLLWLKLRESADVTLIKAVVSYL